jgi:hypothetical protein
MGKEVVNKIFQNWVLEGFETREFLEKQALEILQEERETWWDNLEDEDKNYPKIWEENACEYHLEAEKSLKKYLEKWWNDVMRNVSFSPFRASVPSELLYIFRDWLGYCDSVLDFSEVAEILIEDAIEKDKANIPTGKQKQ